MDEHQYENLSKLHPIFSRAQAILSRLNERDFEEIRTYRAPPVSFSLILVRFEIIDENNFHKLQLFYWLEARYRT